MRDFPSALVLGYSKSQTLALSQFVLCPLQYPMYFNEYWFSFRVETHPSTANTHAASTFSTLGR